jgi:CheY-like chemotaxis protein
MKKVLIVEDDKFLVRVYGQKMRAMGYEIKFLENGENVEKVALEFVPDLIILDIVMPKVDGFDVLTSLKSNIQTAKIPVIALTMLNSSEDSSKLINLGAIKHLYKADLSFKDVQNVVQQFLGE